MPTAPAQNQPQAHKPVLLDETIAALAPCDGEIYIDGTFGAGGYSRAILEAADCAVIAIDRDPVAIEAGATLQKQYGKRFMLAQGCFGDMRQLAAAQGIDAVHGIALDLGVSSMQLDVAERGFSFLRDGALDMRMAQTDHTSHNAADIVNQLDEAQLAQIIAIYGEERHARAIARAISKRRGQSPITRTKELAELVESVLHKASRANKTRTHKSSANKARTHKTRTQKTHPATRTFQALRIYLNDELGALLRGLMAAEHMLLPNGRLAIVTFHSLEDRIVKKFYARRTGRVGRPSRHLPDKQTVRHSFTEIFPNSRRPSQAEIKTNPRARSARLRAVCRTDAPAHIGNDADLVPSLPNHRNHL
ncbi:MAG: 16S rRNA (cytosine(1402)-N(4))-methyltransferase RsmH [Alphaproteobacteria bacterium]|nr:16S rRNA (cytosine(1402)-N(4))-methyltransferase RsmH [Alphaproteobacteria bacterium]